MAIRLTDADRAQVDALRERERLADLERQRQGAPWNRPPHRTQRHAVAATITLFRTPPPRERDPIAGPEPTRPEDITPIEFRLLGEGGLLHLFAESAIAERCRREPRASVRDAFIRFIRASAADGGLGFGLRRPDWWQGEGAFSCDLPTWRFIGERVNQIIRGGPGPW